MPFTIALSGLNASSDDLNVTANNIANASTNGFKESRAQFVEVFAVGSEAIANNVTGSGVRMSTVAQQFSQGNIDFTGNSLDLAVTGQGFFTLSESGSLFYSRAGAFGVDRLGFVVNAENQRLQVYPPLGNGAFNTGGLSDLQLLTDQNPPLASTQFDLGVNLPADGVVPPNGTFDPNDPLSFNHTTSTTVFDSLGAAHTASVFFIKDPAANTWQQRLYVDGTAVGGPTTVQFDSTGNLVVPASGIISHPPFAPGNGANDIVLDLDLQLTTQFGGSFGVNSLSQDGFASGRLTGIEIDASGVVFARFTNGQSEELGKVALSNFPNPQGLGQVGDTTWVETFGSGDALRGEAGTASFGLVQSGALEASNVDLTEQLVNMITAQRNFQANAQVISTADDITQTIINIR
ncbi:MAG: flagellar hook protein FlgE [Pseudomonadota bacterium]